MEDFKVGDVVTLKAAGGPEMVIEYIDEEEKGDITCVWFEKKTVRKSGDFKATSLKKGGKVPPRITRQ